MMGNFARHGRPILKKIPKELTISRIHIVINSFSNDFDRGCFGVGIGVVHVGGSFWLGVRMMGGNQVPLDANIDVHLGVPERVGDISTAPGRHRIVVPVGVPLNPADLGIEQVVVVELPDQPSAILVNIPVDFLGGVLAGDFDRANFGGGCGVAHG